MSNIINLDREGRDEAPVSLADVTRTADAAIALVLERAEALKVQVALARAGIPLRRNTIKSLTDDAMFAASRAGDAVLDVADAQKWGTP